MYFKNRDALQIYPKLVGAHQFAKRTQKLYMNYRKHRSSVQSNFLQRGGFTIHPLSALKKEKCQLSLKNKSDDNNSDFLTKYSHNKQVPLYSPEQAGGLNFGEQLDQFQLTNDQCRVVEDSDEQEEVPQCVTRKSKINIFPYSPLSRQLNEIIRRKRQIRFQEEQKSNENLFTHDSFRQKLKQAINQLKRNKTLHNSKENNIEQNQEPPHSKYEIDQNQLTPNHTNNTNGQNQRDTNNFHMVQTQNYQNASQTNVRRVTRYLAKSDPNLKIELQLGYKSTKIDKPRKIVTPSKNNIIKNKKTTKKIKKHQYLEQEWDIFKSAPLKETNFEALLLCNLPSRNPITKHQYNCQSHRQIDFYRQLIENRLYFTSELLNYDFKQRKMKISCNTLKSLFIGDTLKSTRNCRILTLPPENEVKKIKLRRNFQYTNRKILVLDLDETLVHSQGLGETPNKELFPCSFQFQKIFRYFSVRNYAREFLRKLAQKYYIVVFTSAVQGYADCILQTLDPEEKYVQHRLYRQHCYLRGQGFPYIKDLRILNRDLSQVVIVDNSLYAFWFQVDNGVPITSFMGIQDQQLRKLQQYLLRLQHVDDIRVINHRTFHMHLFQQSDTAEELLNKMKNLVNQEQMNVEAQ